jgi:hypothetical protein
MEYQDLVAALMAARNKAQLQGRPLSSEETRDISSGYFDNAANRTMQSRAISFQGKHNADSLALERWRMLKMMEAAKDTNKNQLIGNALKSGVGLAGLYYTK